MPLARSALLFLVISAGSLFAQIASQSVLTFRVQDGTSAFIPNAAINIRSGSGPAFDLQTDARGEATVRLGAGEYSISVSALGFRHWTSNIALTGGSPRSINVELKVGEIYGPTVVDDSRVFESEHYAPLIELPTLPLESLTLRPHRLRFLRFQRGFV